MPITEFGGGAITDEEHRRRRRRSPSIPQPPSTPPPGGSSGGGGGSSSGGGGGASNQSSQSNAAQDARSAQEKALAEQRAAERKADREEERLRRKAGNRYVDQAENLEAQARALRRALEHSYKRNLNVALENVNEILKDQDKTLMQGYRERVQSLRGSMEDNEKAQATQSEMAGQNRVRERNSALSEAMAQGAGESDALQAQVMSLRNWQANQNEITRSLYDTLRSVNSSLTDLNVDTKTGRINLQAQALADKEQLWTNYYNQRSESYTQLGNIRGQQADYLDMAKEYGVGKGSDNTGGAAFMAAANEQAKHWDSPGISNKLMRWDGRKEFKAPDNGQSKLAAAPTVDLGKAPEGATLRKW